MAEEVVLRRYTDIAALIYLLQKKKITLLDPGSWDDKNDTHYLQIYKTKKELKTLLALCFTTKSETYHHWHVFAGRSGGVCISFNKKELLRELSKTSGIRHGAVEYKLYENIKASGIRSEELPFLKRYGFRDEKEYRIVFESTVRESLSKDISIPLSCIHKIYVNPWIPPVLYRTIKKQIQSIDGCSELNISKSPLVKSSRWQSLAESSA